MPADLAVVDPDLSVAEQAAIMGKVCEEIGFFRVPVSAVDRSVVDDAWNAATDFFDLPDKEKRRIEFPEPGYPYGYSPFGYEALGRSIDDTKSAAPDLKESLSVGPDCGPSPARSSDEDSWIRSPSLWPARPAELCSAWTAYYRALSSLAEHLMAVMAVALDLESDYFASMIDHPITSMRALRYPRLDPTAALLVHSGSIRAGAHTDYGTLTILRTDDVAGLEVQDRSGEWVQVEPDPEMFVVNLGDSIAQWTNDRWRSTLHRVTPASETSRQSMAFFHMANWDAVIECLPTCLEPGATPRHVPVHAGPWLMRKFQSTVVSANLAVVNQDLSREELAE